MRIAFVTMVWRDPYFLELWMRHNGAIAGRENLFVISHGPDPETARLAEGANLITIPRDEPDDSFDETRWAMLSDIASGLSRYYDRVVVGDVDELLLSLDPARSLADLLAEVPQGQVTAPAGFELMPADDAQVLDETRPILSQIWKGVLSGSYSKPCILSGPARLGPGGHGSATRCALETRIALLHLRYLPTDALLQRRAARMALAEEASRNTDRSGKAFLRGWRRAEGIRARIRAQYDAAVEVPSAEAPARAAAALEQARQQRGGYHSFSVNRLRAQDFRIVLDPALRDVF